MDEIPTTTFVMEAESYNPVYEGLVVVFVFLRRFSFLDWRRCEFLRARARARVRAGEKTIPFFWYSRIRVVFSLEALENNPFFIQVLASRLLQG